MASEQTSKETRTLTPEETDRLVSRLYQAVPPYSGLIETARWLVKQAWEEGYRAGLQIPCETGYCCNKTGQGPSF